MSAPSRRLLRPSLVVALGVVAASILSGCTAAVPMQSADGANDPACADVVVHLPETVGPDSDPQQRRETDAQGTGAWGTPSTVLLRCGVESPAVSDLPCNPIQGVDWLSDDGPEDGDTFTFTTYGRTPAVQVVVSAEVGSTALFDLADAVGYLPEDGRGCVGVEDLPSVGDPADNSTDVPSTDVPSETPAP
ncbi:DUF3515 domain-containing protein [Frigoribacterium sp. PhB116]|uniref:DUF3515 domain-containing protein n=1 Tax=Frigoribacterium sp. PhB116 TaxID=2485174 RepID=UPI00105BD61B|nr:DUF3515 domain-containing protein [Frigoribacterium sp. PhB116]TDT65979.1 uncharacterized protein DUF3515 [Frigoribacterium sp. PhB116]